MVHGEDHLKASAATRGYTSAGSAPPKEAYSVADAIDAAGRARGSLAGLAEMAELLLAKITGPTPARSDLANDKGALGGPRGVVDQLHYEIRGMSDPLTRIEFALRDIDARIG